MKIMINQKKVYIGGIKSEIEAAKYYDHIAILTQGLNSKTNFAYTAAQLEKIVKDYDFTTDGVKYLDMYSQMTAGYFSKQDTQMETNFNDYSQSNYQLSKRQRREDGVPPLEKRESSDENAMIGNHTF